MVRDQNFILLCLFIKRGHDMVKKILIVEDEKDINELATVRLRHAGYEIIQAFDAEEALICLKNNLPDLILLDLFLPKMQGEDFCKKIKADDRLKKITVIIFTAGSCGPTSLERLKEMGASDCVFKPYSSEELIGKVKKYIG